MSKLRTSNTGVKDCDTTNILQQNHYNFKGFTKIVMSAAPKQPYYISQLPFFLCNKLAEYKSPGYLPE